LPFKRAGILPKAIKISTDSLQGSPPVSSRLRVANEKAKTAAEKRPK